MFAALMLTLTPIAVHAQQKSVDPAVIAKGEYLARAGDCIACHTGRRSCFSRAVRGEGGDISLSFVDAERLFDPAEIYRK